MSLDFSLVRRGKYDDGEDFKTEVFTANITHNLNKMAEAVGIYKALWRPDENGFAKAKEIVSVVEKSLTELKNNPTEYKKYDSENGWGVYIHFVPFVESVLDACKEYPEAIIEVWR
jgi:hypothetical protein